MQALGQAGLLGQNDLGLCGRIGGVKRESFPAQLANSTGSEKQHVVFFFYMIPFLYDPETLVSGVWPKNCVWHRGRSGFREQKGGTRYMWS